VYFLGEELVSFGHVFERLGIFGRSNFGGDVGVFQLEGQRHPLVALDLRTLLVAVQPVVVSGTRKVVANVHAVTVVLEHLGRQLGSADATVLSLVLAANHNAAQVSASALHFHPLVTGCFGALSRVTGCRAFVATVVSGNGAWLRAG